LDTRRRFRPQLPEEPGRLGACCVAFAEPRLVLAGAEPPLLELRGEIVDALLQPLAIEAAVGHLDPPGKYFSTTLRSSRCSGTAASARSPAPCLTGGCRRFAAGFGFAPSRIAPGVPAPCWRISWPRLSELASTRTASPYVRTNRPVWSRFMLHRRPCWRAAARVRGVACRRDATCGAHATARPTAG